MNYGWIKLHRKLLQHPTFKDAERFQVFAYLLLRASYSNPKVSFNGRDRTLQPGQLISSRDAIARDLNMNSSKVERILKRLQSERQIEQQGLNTGRLITVTNWSRYQSAEQPSEQLANSHQTAAELPSNTYKKEDENGEAKSNNTTTPLPPKGEDREGIDFAHFWTEYPKKHDKARAAKSWAKLSPKEQRDAIVALPKHRRSEQWQRDVIPHAATWINGKRWLDEVKDSYANAPRPAPKPPEPPPPWMDAMRRILELRKAKGDDLTMADKMGIVAALRAFPKSAWSYFRPDEYNFFNALLKEVEKKAITASASPADVVKTH